MPGPPPLIAAGRRLGPYEVVAPLGAGGMGEVYRARDTRLGRDVALKILPPQYSSDAERRRRFDQEVRAVASLSHPNILALHDVGSEEGISYAIFELLEGETMRRKVERGALPGRTAIEWGVQICRGLAAAHARGIVHRDLKPENLAFAADGSIKILDFGLARLTGSASEAEVESAETRSATAPGLVLGTAAYMSPEQARGRPADARSDLFSLGAVLYEMVTGERAFRGATSTDTLYAVLHHDPPEMSSPHGPVPGGLELIVRRCLEKEPDQRFQTARDLGFALEMLSEAPLGTPRSAGSGPRALGGDGEVGRRRFGRVPLLVWPIAAAVLAAGTGLWLREKGRAQSHEAAPPTTITPFTTDGGMKYAPKVSPDGERVAYSWAGAADDNWDIYVKGMGLGAAPLRLTTHPGNDWGPVWSPDGRQIAFVREGEIRSAIYLVPSLGGQERKLVDLQGPVHLATYIIPRLSWSPDGDALVFGERLRETEPVRIVRLAFDTLEKQRLTHPPAGSQGDLSPEFSPDGRSVAFVRWEGRAWGNIDIWIQPLSGGEARRLTSARYDQCEGLAWTPGGDEVLFSTTNAFFGGLGQTFRIPIAGGRARPVAGIGTGGGFPSVRGSRMVHVQVSAEPAAVWRVPGRLSSAADRRARPFIKSSVSEVHASFSPDGRKIAFGSHRSGVENIWVCDADGSRPVQLTNLQKGAGWPSWSPDGKAIVFDSPEGGQADVYLVDAEGGAPRRLTLEPSSEGQPSFSRDGRSVYFNSDRSGRSEVWRTPVEGGPAQQLTHGGGFHPLESYDGRQLYFLKDHGLWQVPVDGSNETKLVPAPGLPYFAVARSGLYATGGDPPTARLKRWGRGEGYSIQFLDLRSLASFKVEQLRQVFRDEGDFHHQRLDVSPGEEWILYTAYPHPTSELVLVDGFR